MTKEKITSLTPEQEALLPVYRDKAIKIGLSTNPYIDEQEVKDKIDAHRKAVGLPLTSNWLFYDSPYAALTAHKELTPATAIYGSMDISWLSNYMYYRDVLKLEFVESAATLLEMLKVTGWLWLTEDTTVVTKQPLHLRMIEKPTREGESLKVLHSYTHKAVEYIDGTGLYAMNGVVVPDDLEHLAAKLPEEISPAEVLAIKNTEIRSEFIKKVGVRRMFDSLEKETLDRQTIDFPFIQDKGKNVADFYSTFLTKLNMPMTDGLYGGTYELFRVKVGEHSRIYLQGSCPSNDESFFEAVHPDCRTVEQALNFRRGAPLDEPYLPPVILT